MKALETQRLVLRKFTESDFDAVHSYACRVENIIYMPWGPNTEADTREFLRMAIAEAEETPCTNYKYAVVLKSTGALIGGCTFHPSGDEAEIGWIVHSDYWKQGYGAEMGKALLDFGFGEANLRRIAAHCDAENIASYRVMEKIGMRREGYFIEGRPAHKRSDQKYGDELSYAILKEEWEIRKEIAWYNALPYVFHDFIDVPALADGGICLVCTDKKPAIPAKKYVPDYCLMICKDGEKIGYIDLRIGYTDGLYYGGQIGYGVEEAHRGNGYAAAACRLLLPVARAHGMQKLLITNNHTNTASRRVCEKLGARLVRVARLPEWHELYQEGQRFVNVYEWDVG